MIRVVLFISLIFSATHIFAQGRLESEYKLDVPLEEVSAVWDYLQSTYGRDEVNIGDLKLNGNRSTEIFVDKYFDSEDGRFAEAEISLRHRKRFKDGKLIKELLQLKTPFSEDKVVRNEIKFDVAKKKQVTDPRSRHDFLKHLKNVDEKRMAFNLAPYALRPGELRTALKLKQTRNRIYLMDAVGKSYATLTLDEVSHTIFPFQSYAELELELNEVRYTQEDEKGRTEMEALNEEIRKALFASFPSLKVDQRSKYRKMKELVVSSLTSKIYAEIEWFFLGAITFTTFVLFLKDELS